jgi:2-polyprenyl-3-methyl-5-hydroxy-6-metoxy-1,4-benzoquinol methylase
MTISNSTIDRGKAGRVPALTTRADEVYNDFMSDTRNTLLHAYWKQMSERGNALMDRAGVKIEHTHEGVAKARDVIVEDPYLSTFLRVKRTAQEIYKQRIVESYKHREDEFLRRLDDAEKRGPGTLTYDKDFVYPDYSKVHIHIQPGGYVGTPLAGMYYDYGTSIFYGGENSDDALHKRLAEQTPGPKDGKLERILEIGCGIGQMSVEMKRVHPTAEVIATDISAPMIRYGHWRACEQNMAVHFAQMPSETLDFPDGHFDLVFEHILFHEIPIPVLDKTLKEVFRVLRPGGTFVVWDFASAEPGKPGYSGLVGLMDAADNGEPYAHEFVTCNVEKRLEDVGFQIRSRIQPGVMMGSRVCDKPL